MTAEEQKIWETFCHLNDRGKDKAVEYLKDLSEQEKYSGEEIRTLRAE